MDSVRYIFRSLIHYRFAYLGVLAGATLGATVLLGGFFAGDSVAASLRQIGENRIGRSTHLLSAGDRFFRQALAGEFATAAGVQAAPVLLLRGTVSAANSRATANQVQLVGVTPSFWTFAPQATSLTLDAAKSEVAINDTLARRLNVAVGDTLIVRLQKPGIVAGNAPIAGAEATLQNVRGKVVAILHDESFGRFSLDGTQIPPPSVFLPAPLLEEAVGRPGRANLLLIAANGASMNLVGPLAQSLRLADYGLTLKWQDLAATFELTSDRVFLDPLQSEAIVAAIPEAQPVVSYLVNEFRLRDRRTPYSIAAGTTRAAAPFLPADLGPREVVINQWLADDLQAVAGDNVALTFFQSGAAGTLVEKSADFRVRAIVPLQGLAADKAWMPTFPGMSDVQHQSDWDPGLPLDLKRIRDKDEKYWEEYRGAPKAFISIAAGQELWGTRWGTTTALRIPGDRTREAALTETLLRALRPEMNQLLVRDLRTTVEAAAKSPVDFGGLFLGMSFFLIVAALGLVAMLFQLNLLQRNREDALLAAVGIGRAQLMRWRLLEGFALLAAGAAIGLPLAMLYTRGILRFLESIWAGEGNGVAFEFAAAPASIAIGLAVFLFFSLLAIWFAIRRQTRAALSIRLAARAEDLTPRAKIRRTSLLVAIAAAVIGAAAIASSGRGIPQQGAFYLAGCALLTCGLALCRRWMAREASSDKDGPLDAAYLGMLNLRTRRSRGLTVVGLIATAVFMVLSVASFRKQVGDNWRERESGTGGFAFWVETTAPLNAARDGGADGFESLSRLGGDLGEVVPLRVGAGDNANCFNLNTTAQPRLLSVDATRLAALNSFRLKLAADKPGNGWQVLQSPQADGSVPALVDETTLLWALKKKVGDTIAYTDENGRPFDVRIVGAIPDSIFQGHVIVDERRFLERFPSNAGYSIFLIDAKPNADLAALRNRLGTTLADAGGRVEITRDVLAAFHGIENTYIAIFNVLGTLGVVLGSLGLAIVVARSLRERRGEFAVMSAIGIPRGVLARMVFAEFGRLVAWGISIGVAASALAVWPNVTSFPAGPAVILVGGLLAGIVVFNLACGWAVFRWSVRDLRPSIALAG